MTYITASFDDQVAGRLTQGDVGFMPSDTIYGLSCAASNEAAVNRLYRLKQRSSHKPFIILISHKAQLTRLGIDASAIVAAEKYWPGPLTVLCPANAPEFLDKGTGTLAVRLPDEPELRSLINKTGPLISTSANLGGQPPTHSVAEAYKIFGDQLDFYVDRGRLSGLPSTIVGLEGDGLKVIRYGAVKIEARRGHEI